MRINVRMMECYFAGGILGGKEGRIYIYTIFLKKSKVITFPDLIKNSLKPKGVLKFGFIRTKK